MRALYILLAGQLVSVFGSSLTGFALPVYLYELNHSTMDYAVARLLVFLPALLLLPAGGIAADRYNRKAVMLIADGTAAMATVVLLVAAFTGEIRLVHIFGAIVVGSMAGAFQGPAYSAVMAHMIPRAQMVRISGTLQAVNGGLVMAAPMIAAWLLLVVGLRGVLAIDLLTFALAALTLACVRLPKMARGDGPRPSARRDLTEALGFLRTRRGLPAFVLLLACSNLVSAGVTVLYAPLILGHFSVAAFGVLTSIQGGALIAGGLSLRWWQGPRDPMRGILLAMTVQAAAVAVSGWSTNLYVLGSASFVFSFSVPLGVAQTRALWQRKVPDAMQGRVMSLRGMAANLATLTGYLAAAPLAQYILSPALSEGGTLAGSLGALIGTGPTRGTGAAFLLLAALQMAAVVAAALTPHLRDLADRLPDAPETP